jgi:hypothetical protein
MKRRANTTWDKNPYLAKTGKGVAKRTFAAKWEGYCAGCRKHYNPGRTIGKYEGGYYCLPCLSKKVDQ